MKIELTRVFGGVNFLEPSVRGTGLAYYEEQAMIKFDKQLKILTDNGFKISFETFTNSFGVKYTYAYIEVEKIEELLKMVDLLDEPLMIYKVVKQPYIRIYDDYGI